MKQVIRRSVFETNSSSMHSIAISKYDSHYTDQEIYNSFSHFDKHYGKREDLHIQFFEVYGYDNDKSALSFGRFPFKILSTFCDKLRYYIAFRSNM